MTTFTARNFRAQSGDTRQRCNTREVCGPVTPAAACARTLSAIILSAITSVAAATPAFTARRGVFAGSAESTQQLAGRSTFRMRALGLIDLGNRLLRSRLRRPGLFAPRLLRAGL
ncbi:MAG: hypothetical protein WBA38_06955, partial [Gordonia sp. (in: high G+C Gram-positive bacteria)]|uniref:hypothetical protein n=1 Tax=Gordonia sp. (in: high G+C Gram-positive bacteria) TaxID=84139 RepID=UPI003C7398C6